MREQERVTSKIMASVVINRLAKGRSGVLYTRRFFGRHEQLCRHKARCQTVSAAPALLGQIQPTRLIQPWDARCIRSYSNPTPPSPQLELQLFHILANNTLDAISESVDKAIEVSSNPDYDLDYADCVLTITLGENGTYVLNKQPPNLQIWLSSPLSGPKRYDWDPIKHEWIYRRDGSSLEGLLKEELSDIFHQPISLYKDAL